MSRPLVIVGVCGAGAMGAGIAQTAAMHGANVRLFDVSTNALAEAQARVTKSIEGLVAKSRIDKDAADAALDRLTAVSDLDALSDCDLIIEAIVEDAETKADLFAKIEAVVPGTTVIASNTSSLPIARLAKSLDKPARFVGMHFFNPATVMKLVEVVAGPSTDKEVLDAVQATAEAWGKVAVPVADVPGFIVNRVARPFYAEAFAALQERAAEPNEIDALFRGVGFRMGPLELTDFIGQDVNYTVARSVYESYFGRTRFVPQLKQAALVDAGWLGRKSGRGVYNYSSGQAAESQAAAIPEYKSTGRDHATADRLRRARPGEVLRVGNVDIALTRGTTARRLAERSGRPVAIFDWFNESASDPIGFAVSDDTAAAIAHRVCAALERQAVQIADRPGLVVCRTLAQIANAASDAVFEHVSSEEGIDAALRFGANYPIGPFAWADRFGRANVRNALKAIAAETGDTIYAPSQYMKGWS